MIQKACSVMPTCAGTAQGTVMTCQVLSARSAAGSLLLTGRRQNDHGPWMCLHPFPRQHLPSLKLPSLKLPSLKLPSLKLPSLKLPSLKLPSLKLPSLKLPAPAQSPQSQSLHPSDPDQAKASQELSQSKAMKMKNSRSPCHWHRKTLSSFFS